VLSHFARQRSASANQCIAGRWRKIRSKAGARIAALPSNGQDSLRAANRTARRDKSIGTGPKWSATCIAKGWTQFRIEGDRACSLMSNIGWERSRPATAHAGKARTTTERLWRSSQPSSISSLDVITLNSAVCSRCRVRPIKFAATAEPSSHTRSKRCQSSAGYHSSPCTRDFVLRDTVHDHETCARQMKVREVRDGYGNKVRFTSSSSQRRGNRAPLLGMRNCPLRQLGTMRSWRAIPHGVQQ